MGSCGICWRVRRLFCFTGVQTWKPLCLYATWCDAGPTAKPDLSSDCCCPTCLGHYVVRKWITLGPIVPSSPPLIRKIQYASHLVCLMALAVNTPSYLLPVFQFFLRSLMKEYWYMKPMINLSFICIYYNHKIKQVTYHGRMHRPLRRGKLVTAALLQLSHR
jgi:hypothetical protein